MFILNKGHIRKKDTRTYKNFKHWSKDKPLEIINEPYNRGINGHDYQPYIEEIKQAYYEKVNKNE
jgi:hypothetical protein